MRQSLKHVKEKISKEKKQKIKFGLVTFLQRFLRKSNKPDISSFNVTKLSKFGINVISSSFLFQPILSFSVIQWDPC